VHRDAGLVVARTAAVEPTVALGRHEGGRVPQGGVAWRLHVVVGVEQHGGGAGGSGPAPDDGRRPAGDAQDLDLGQARPAQELGDGGRARLDLLLVERRRRHARDADQGLEVGADAGHHGGEPAPKDLDVRGDGELRHGMRT
jgi:hypothetical protein